MSLLGFFRPRIRTGKEEGIEGACDERGGGGRRRGRRRGARDDG